ncbi:Qat anti-phage system QueC-like protein QatC [Asticcacaulis benevestitus]|uniref:ATPase n=1 Tax=Asticcacaulis benevestitus DSM 16100 = ATCC BAA-896 TaxID=1121022 RepID=V4PKM7_9CAUL|nr:Qat anti-phage system QueC-like protein QatC [Asticcacaulis benevestitus]ESQ87804.1 hypothetical protein ABENE_16765 [Asticcacaulis benevestitus DSM 16100 = ATCC BAA-896]
MTTYILAGHMGPLTKPTPDLFSDPDSRFGTLDIIPGKRAMSCGISSAMRQLADLNIFPSEVALDLLVLAVMVQAADTRLNRIDTAQDSWTREIKLIVPVSDPKLWTESAAVLREMLNFLTGDFWSFEFRVRPHHFKLLVRKTDKKPKTYNGVSLFSGGLDSLIGAIDELKKNAIDAPFFVSHAGEAAVSSPQTAVFAALEKKHAQRALHRLRFPSARFPQNIFPEIRLENSTRGRSFLFFALAALAGSGLGSKFDLRVPENGLIALNVPLDGTRLGSLSTRTTHPFYIHRWNQLLKQLGIEGQLINPYWNQTKGEMADKCQDRAFLQSILPLSVSCAHPSADRYKGGGNSHCGHCVPCVIRRAATFRAWGAGGDQASYRLNNLTGQPLVSTKAEGIQIRAFQYAIAHLAKHPGFENIAIHKPGSLAEDIERLPDLAAMYKRGMDEVSAVLKGVVTAP